MTFVMQTYPSPFGTLYLVAEGDKVRGIAFEASWPRLAKRFRDVTEGPSPVLEETARQLSEYFAGKRRVFDLPLEAGGTPFQQSVWTALKTIGFGETRTYKQQAEMVGVPKGARAVGLANGLNPLCIVVPCHRVVGSDGKMTGYAGGLAVKTKLLRFENETR